MDNRRTIILLASEALTAHLRDFLLARNKDLRIDTPETLEALRETVTGLDGSVRVLSFLNDLIIPADVLNALKLAPYNIHPGPPEFPGAHPESFAIWEAADRYGVTAHEMTTRVDAGPITATSHFGVPVGADRKALSDLTMREAIKVFAVVAVHCAFNDSSMPPMTAQWSGVKRTKKQFRALCRSYHATPEKDRARLIRACGDNLEKSAAA